VTPPPRAWVALPEMPIELECGHRIDLPLGADPTVGAAELVHHRFECRDLGPASGESWPSSAPWSVRRLESSR
jgi:hypothetical protein